MGEKEVNISASGLGHLKKLRIENDFTFIVGDNRYDCPWFIAEFVSPRVSQLRSVDITMTEFHIETNDPGRLFESILTLGWGSTIFVSEETFSFFVSISRELCNWELYFRLYEVFNENLSVSKFYKEFKDYEMTDDFPEQGIGFLSSHFYEIDSSFLNGLPISIIIRILSNSSLRLKTEDSLYKMIRSEIERNSEFIELFSFVRFEFLSVELIGNFISWSCEHFEILEQFFTQSLWTAISCRLCLSVNIKCPPERYHFENLHFVPQSSNPLSGIISYLTSKHEENVHDRGIVNVSGSTIYRSCAAKNAVDLLSTSFFHSQNEPNQWLCYDFKDRKVRPTHYSVHAHSGNYYLRSWILEGSIDGSSWAELDHHTNDQTTNSNHPIGTFSISSDCKYQFLRVRQTGVNANGNHEIILYAMEIFGDLIE
jgi:hypothetical protein